MKLIHHNTEIAHWYDLILRAQEDASVYLEHELEGYVVTMLMRFNQSNSLSDAVLALEFLEALDGKNSVRHNRMREVADKCLIYTGLFPSRAERKRVNKHYFIQLGQSAYGCLRDKVSCGMPLLSRLYEKLSLEFTNIVNVISAMRLNNVKSVDEKTFEVIFDYYKNNNGQHNS